MEQDMEGNFYTKQIRERILDEDGLSPEEEGFMHGYEEELDDDLFIHERYFEGII